MSDFSRTRRVGEQMQRELAELIQREVRDPRVGMVTVSAVEVSRDMSHAKVFITRLGDEGLEEAIKALKHAAGFLRRELGRRMRLRKIPELHFIHDVSIERGNRLAALINEAVAEENKESDDE